MRINKIICLSILLVLSGCSQVEVERPRSLLEIRAVQTREYDVVDTKLVMKALLNVLQDEGFVTKNAVVDLGLITATKEIDTESRGSMIWSTIIAGNEARWTKSEVVEATANVSEFGSQTRVRLSFKRKVLDNYGNAMRMEEIGDSIYYQNIFAKLDKGIFIQKERI